MTIQELSSIDFFALTKADLKLFCKKARAVWGKPIDLRDNCRLSMIEYLQDFLTWKIQEVQQEIAIEQHANVKSFAYPTKSVALGIVPQPSVKTSVTVAPSSHPEVSIDESEQVVRQSSVKKSKAIAAEKPRDVESDLMRIVDELREISKPKSLRQFNCSSIVRSDINEATNKLVKAILEIGYEVCPD
ncbi:MAG: hypothetical protein PUP93_33165 [Rhizonema sp. NSF051]|nr:hypothetical protein [Rhizonema sp. NSF051]